MKPWLAEPRFRAARVWSNRVLASLAPLFHGSVVNVSAWRDEDKEGRHYRDYFTHATEYWLTNWRSDARGYQGHLENEIYLDLEQPLPEALQQRFDVVFNHTTLEHVFDVFGAFHNLCQMSRDALIVVVPFLQEQHGDYGDYWRFTPEALFRLLERENMRMSYLAANDQSVDAIYLLAVGTRRPETHRAIHRVGGNRVDELPQLRLGRMHWKGPRWWHALRRLGHSLLGGRRSS